MSPYRRAGTILAGEPGQVIGKTSEGRKIVRNSDGSVSTERTITIEHPDGFMNIPTMYGGRSVSPREAIDIIRKNKGIDPETGRKLRIFKSIPEAEDAARERSRSLADEMRKLGLIE